MAKTITALPASQDHKRQLLNTRSEGQDITITTTGSESVTGTITAPYGFYLEDPTTKELIKNYSFFLEVPPLETFQEQYFVDYTPGTADTRDTYSQTNVMCQDTGYIYIAGRSKSNNYQGDTITPNSTTWNSMMMKIDKDDGSVIWAKLWNNSNQDGASGGFNDVSNFIDNVVEDDSYLYAVTRLSSSFSELLRIRKSDGYIEESIDGASGAFPHVLSLSVHNGRLITAFHAAGTNMTLTSYNLTDFTSSFSQVVAVGRNADLAYNYMFSDGDTVFYFESGYSTATAAIYYEKFTHTGAAFGGTSTGGALTNFPTLWTGSNPWIYSILQDATNKDEFLISMRDRGAGTDKTMCGGFTVPASGNVTVYNWLNEALGDTAVEATIVKKDGNSLFVAVTIAATFDGDALPANTTKYAALAEYSYSAGTIIEITQSYQATPIPSYDAITTMRGNWEDNDFWYMILDSTGALYRDRSGDPDPGVDGGWYEVCIDKIQK